MHGPTLVLLGVGLLWLLAAALVVRLPLALGRIRAGTETVYRETNPDQFWSTYAFAVGLFLASSFLAGIFVYRLVP